MTAKFSSYSELSGSLPDPLGKISLSAAELRLVEALERCPETVRPFHLASR